MDMAAAGHKLLAGQREHVGLMGQLVHGELVETVGAIHTVAVPVAAVTTAVVEAWSIQAAVDRHLRTPLLPPK